MIFRQYHKELPRGARMHSRPGREIFFVQRMLVRGENSVWQMGEYVLFVTFAQSIAFVIYMIYEKSSARV